MDKLIEQLERSLNEEGELNTPESYLMKRASDISDKLDTIEDALADIHNDIYDITMALPPGGPTYKKWGNQFYNLKIEAGNAFEHGDNFLYRLNKFIDKFMSEYKAITLRDI